MIMTVKSKVLNYVEHPSEVNFDKLMSERYKTEKRKRLYPLAFKGEGKTDEEALNQIREQVINFKE